LKGRLALLNFTLAALALLGAWQLRARWLEARAREAALYRQQAAPLPTPPVVPMPPSPPVTAIQYGEVAQQMLFSKDRNPTVEIEAAPVRPMPPLPVAYGAMAFGEVRAAILSPRPGVAHRAYAPGDMVGEFKLVSVERDQIVLEWDGQTLVKPLEELLPKERAAAPQAPAPEPAAAAAPPPPAASTVVAAPVKAGPGMQVAADVRACQVGDTSPVGTVVDGWRKVMTQTPFGTGCRWEPAR
jgi:hypothetical protein